MISHRSGKTKTLFITSIFIIFILALAITVYWVHGSDDKISSQISSLSENVKSLQLRLPSSSNKPPTSAPKSTTITAYHVGETQNYGNLSITLDDTGGGTTMGELPSNETIFSVDITVKNNGTVPYISPSAFVNDSSVYTQVGSDTSTGQYSLAYSTPCFGGGNVIIPPAQSMKGCVQFDVPKNALVDTYFFDNLKWYL